MERQDNTPKRDSKWGTYWVIGLLIAVVCVGVLIYIGWFNNNDHVDSPNGDNVLESYETVTPQPDAPDINDWNNPDQNNLQEIIVDHATGTDTVVLPE